MARRRCLDCGTTFTSKSRCPPCQQDRDRDRNQRRTHYQGGYQKQRAQLRVQWQREAQPCWLCHEAIDYTLTNPHPYSVSADHVTPGDPQSELRPAHLRCNTSRGAKQP